jgi:hypothetical protein
MKVYLHSESAERSAKYHLFACPAGDNEFVRLDDCPREWFMPDGETRRNIPVAFEFGACEVPDSLGKYLIARGVAHKSRLARKVRQFFDAAGKVIGGGVFDEHGRPMYQDYNPGAR